MATSFVSLADDGSGDPSTEVFVPSTDTPDATSMPDIGALPIDAPSLGANLQALPDPGLNSTSWLGGGSPSILNAVPNGSDPSTASTPGTSWWDTVLGVAKVGAVGAGIYASVTGTNPAAGQKQTVKGQKTTAKPASGAFAALGSSTMILLIVGFLFVFFMLESGD